MSRLTAQWVRLDPTPWDQATVDLPLLRLTVDPLRAQVDLPVPVDPRRQWVVEAQPVQDDRFAQAR